MSKHNSCPHDNLYLEDLAEARRQDRSEWEALHRRWVTKFARVHYERYSTTCAAAVAEVTPNRPPYDYRSQEPATRRGRRLADARRRGSTDDTEASSSATQRQAGREHEENDDDEAVEPDREHKREPAWTYWREVLIACPPDRDLALNIELRELADLYLRASNYADPEDAAYCHRLLRPALAECIAYYDYNHLPPGSGHTLSAPERADDPILVSVRHQRAAIERIYERCASRRTVTQYTVGMVIGLALLPLFVALNFGSFQGLERMGRGFELSDVLQGSVHVGTILGAIGAVSSVLLRITSHSVDIDFESTRHGWHVWANPVMQRGLARVVIGTIFGGVAAWFVHAGVLLPDGVTVDLEDPQSAALIVGVFAYISGFSERFIPDLILRTSRQPAPSSAGDGGATSPSQT